MVQGPAQGFFGALGRLPAGRWGPPRQGVRYLGPSGVWDPFSWTEVGPLGVNDYSITRQNRALQQPIRVYSRDEEQLAKQRSDLREAQELGRGTGTVSGQWTGWNTPEAVQLPIQVPRGPGSSSLNRLLAKPTKDRWVPTTEAPSASTKTALADLLAGIRDRAVFTDPAMLSGSFKTGVLGKRPVKYTLSSGDLAVSDLTDSPNVASVYESLAGPAPGAVWSDERGRWEHQDGTPAEIFEIDWTTGLPSDTPVYMRGQAGVNRSERGALNADTGGFSSVDNASENLKDKSKQIGVEMNPYATKAVVFSNGDGTFSLRSIDPSAAVGQEVVNADSTAVWDRGRDLPLGSAVRAVMNETKTPVLTRSKLIEAYQQGRFKPLPQGKKEGTLVGYLDNPAGGEALPVYAPKDRDKNPLTTVMDVATRGERGAAEVSQVEEQIYRVGEPLNRRQKELREGLQDSMPVRQRMMPQKGRPVGYGSLVGALNDYRVLPAEWSVAGTAEAPLLLDTYSLSAEDLRARALALRGQVAQTAGASLPESSRLDLYRPGNSAPTQSLVPEVDDGGRYTGRFLPIARGEEGPAVLVSDALQRTKGEEFGQRQGLSQFDAGLEGTARRVGEGDFMQSPSTADGTRLVARLVIAGKITPEQLVNDSRIAPLFRPGSYARKILKQEVISESNGAMQLEFSDDAPTAAAAPPLPAPKGASAMTDPEKKESLVERLIRQANEQTWLSQYGGISGDPSKRDPRELSREIAETRLQLEQEAREARLQAAAQYGLNPPRAPLRKQFEGDTAEEDYRKAKQAYRDAYAAHEQKLEQRIAQIIEGQETPFGAMGPPPDVEDRLGALDWRAARYRAENLGPGAEQGSLILSRRVPDPVRASASVAPVTAPRARLAAWSSDRPSSPLPRPVAGRLTPEAVARIKARLAEQGVSLGSLTALSQSLAENAGPAQLALQMADGRPVASLLPNRMAPQRRYLQRWENEMAAEDPWIQPVQPSRDYQPYLRGLGPEAVRRIPPAAPGTRVRAAGPYDDAPYYTARRPAVFGGVIPEGQLPLPW